MIDAMPRPRLPHLVRETINDRTVWYVRKGHGPRIRLRAPYGSKEFRAEYDAAIAGTPLTATGRAARGTLEWLWDRYRETGAWSALSTATRRQRENIMVGVIASAGREPCDAITRKVIIAGRDRRAATPAMARHFLDTMRGLFEWAAEAEHVSADPTVGIKTPKKSTDGHHVWTDAEITAFEARWPVGTRERLAFDILIYTGLRRGDASSLGRQHIRSGVITIRTEKTGETVTIPVLPPLTASIAAVESKGGMAFIAKADGAPLVKEAFGNWFGAACRAAGVPGSAHGLRKVAATRMAENGATVAQLEAVFGWRGGGMASLYTRKANRQKIATGAAHLMLPEQNGAAYSRPPMGTAGKTEKKKG